ncbi:unnamed protein product [Acanthosepion pharaonis]|uniref:Uncharacterized protein n=1 Tax=Acanthosepion pharaonis TaxID=158019 RepID=A0A812DZ51_ACAPH|nr:unnamed protein product [Sepia pharaonis]
MHNVAKVTVTSRTLICFFFLFSFFTSPTSLKEISLFDDSFVKKQKKSKITRSKNLQYLAVPAKMPQEWQPDLHNWNPYTCSYADVAKRGWQKWSAIQPNWLAKKNSSCHPDWYNRRVNNIRRTNYKAMNYHYERPLKPTSRTHDNFVSVSGEVMPKKTTEPMPPNRSFSAQPLLLGVTDGDIPAPNWGRYHPDFYGDPYRLQSLPPIRSGGNFHVMKEVLKFERV